MPPATVEHALPYAEPGVRTAPRRTLPRVLGRWVWNVLRTIARLIQFVLLCLGYAVLWLAIVTHAVLVLIATALLFAGRLRWNGRAVRVWAVRTFNRTRLRISRRVPFRRNPVPLATPHPASGA